MLKRERQLQILEMIRVLGTVSVSDIVKELGVSDMTVRRDFDEMAKDNLIIRTHGGAKLIETSDHEKSHLEKQDLQTAEKKAIALKAVSLIKDSETIFIGPGTTLEYLASYLKNRKLRVITNSLPVFHLLKNELGIDLILIGGEYREITGAFVGSIAAKSLSNLRFSKVFISANAINENVVATYSEDEGTILQLVLEQAIESYLLVDHTKFGKFDFFNFYNPKDIDYIMTDKKITNQIKEIFSHQLILASKD